MHSSTRFRSAGLSVLAIALVAGLSAPAQAQSVTALQRSFINLGFELPHLGGNPCRVYIDQAAVPGWTTTHTLWRQEKRSAGCASVIEGFVITGTGDLNGPEAPILEIWRGPRDGISARSGAQFAELNAEDNSRISQNVCLVNGDQVTFRFSHRGRGSASVPDVMRFLIGDDEHIRVGTTSSGTGSIVSTRPGTSATFGSGGGGWVDYGGGFTYDGASGVTNIGFEAISTGGGQITAGNFLDEIQVELHPFIELAADGFESGEGAGSNDPGLPSLAVSGSFAVDLDVVITVVAGGTAVLGTDFTTPTGSAQFSVTVPAGDYDGTQRIALGLQPIGNSLIDGTRTVALQLEPDDSSYYTRSTSQCGVAGAANATWSILDDDLDLSIEKTASATTAAVGDSVTYTLDVSHLDGVDGSGAVVRDPAVDGLDCSAATLSCSESGGAVCPASPTIGALQGAGLVIPTLPVGGGVSITFACTVVEVP